VKEWGIATGLLGLVLMSALAVVWVREEVRQADLDMRERRDHIRQLETEWGRLQLERAALAARSRVERLARERFRMQLPDSGQIWDFRP
jgi:cell division protein FtsL